MKTDIKRLKRGRRLFLGLALLFSGCRDSVPPIIEVCTLDGFGGGDCVEKDGTRLYRKPSEMLNYWSTNQEDMKAFSAWAYDVPEDVVAAEMAKMARKP